MTEPVAYGLRWVEIALRYRQCIAIKQKGDDIIRFDTQDADYEDEGTAAASAKFDGVLHRIIIDRPAALRQLYWRVLSPDSELVDAVRPEPGGSLRIAKQATVSFDTYFNGLFERHWRLYTHAGAFTLALQVTGRVAIRIWRRTPDTGCTLLHEQDIAGAAQIALALDTPHFRQAGLLWFDVTALDEVAVLHSAAWSTRSTGQASARLGIAICTFNRERELGAVLEAIAGDCELETAVARVIVVNQGRPGLIAQPGIAAVAARLGPRLRVVEQANLGGAGGFGRGLLEVLDDSAVTHVCLLDDDVRVEPESLRRMAAFFTLAADDVALGGHMLDSICPTTLYEAGAVVLPNWAPKPLHHGLDLTDPETLDALLDPYAMHFNGWWMFGFPKRWVERIGMPLPCFIRGDDIEFGLRLHEAGLPTVPMPGVGIWHEPFYLKLGGWQLYYETRNALICAALHQDFTPNRVAVLLLKRLLIQLLTYRYYNAALIVRGIEDGLLGPAILEQDPRPLHAGLAALRDRHPEVWIRRERVLPAAPVAASPRWLPGFCFVMARALLGNWSRPTHGDAAPQRLDVKDLVWFRVLRSDCLAVDTHWDRNLPTYRRNRASFRDLMRAGLSAIWRLRAAAARLRSDWHTALPRLSSIPFWRNYVRHGASRSGR
jgi:galactofuranosylgalactofuranosylrhamnosyl-N-acetylglucosaminyl-diphospho-decaprenol beta-1,5/1,6-galactofuranosyltransferase